MEDRAAGTDNPLCGTLDAAGPRRAFIIIIIITDDRRSRVLKTDLRLKLGL
jgi:hypothetical protein